MRAVGSDLNRPFFGHSIVSWRILGILCDVTTVVGTPNILEAFVQCI